MRKNLLITSALGLAAALPSLAMAEAAASGAAVGGGCQSGFFFGVEAKGASMRLRIKKDTKAKRETLDKFKAVDEETDEEKLLDALVKDAADKAAAVLGATDVTLAGLDTLAGGPALAARGNVNFYDEITAADAAALFELLRTRVALANGVAAVAGGPIAAANGIVPRLGNAVGSGAGFGAPAGVATEGALVQLGAAAGGAAGPALAAAGDTIGLDAIKALLTNNNPIAAVPASAAGPGGTIAADVAGVAVGQTYAQAATQIIKNLFTQAAAAGAPGAAIKAIADKFTVEYNTVDAARKAVWKDANGGLLASPFGTAGAATGVVRLLSLSKAGQQAYTVSTAADGTKTANVFIGAKAATAVAPGVPAFARGAAADYTALSKADAANILAKSGADKLNIIVVATDLGGADDAANKKIIKDALPTADGIKDLIKKDKFYTDLAAKNAKDAKARVEASKADTAAKNAQLDSIKTVDLKDGTEHNSSLMGGVGAVAGYRHVLGQFAVSARVGADYLWGGFRTVEKDNSTTDDKIAKLGFGVSPAIGVHFLASPSAELGLVGGVRFGQLQARKIDAAKKADDKKGDYTSKWIWMPFVQGEATVWFAQNISGSVFAGYNFAVEQKFDKEGTTLSNDKKDAQVKVDGIFGGFRVAYHF